MLVLSRKVGERILIGSEIAVTVVRITGGGVRIGIEAPAEMPVIREELKIAMDKESAESGKSKVNDKGATRLTVHNPDAIKPLVD